MSASDVRHRASTATPLPPSAPRRQQRRDRGDDDDPDDHHVGGQYFAIREPDARHPTVGALDPVDHHGQPHIDAARAVLGLVESRQPLPRDAREHAVERLEHDHMLAACRQHRRRLQPDIAAAHHHHPLDPGQFADHPVDVRAAAHRMDTRQVVPRTGQPPRRAARRPDQSAIADRSAVIGCHDMRSGIDRHDATPQQQIDPALVPERGRTDQQPLERLVARQIVLAERWAFVRQVGFGVDDRERPRMARLAQRDRRLRPGMPATDDQDVVRRPHASRVACQRR